jgi:hypothetical protein
MTSAVPTARPAQPDLRDLRGLREMKAQKEIQVRLDLRESRGYKV